MLTKGCVKDMSNLLGKIMDRAPKSPAGRAAAGLFAGLVILGPVVSSCSGDSDPQADRTIPTTTTEVAPTTNMSLGDGCDSPVIETGETIWGKSLQWAGVGEGETSSPRQEALARRYTQMMTDAAAELGYSPNNIPAGTELPVCYILPD